MNRLDTEIRRAMGELDAVAPMARPLEQLNTRPPQRSRPVAAVTLALVVSLSVAIAATVIYARTGEHSAIAPSGSTADSLPTDPTTSPSPTATVGEPSPTELAPGLPILVPTDLPAPLFVWSVGRGRQFSAGQTSECYYFAVSALEEPPGPWPSSDVVRVKVCNAAMAGDGDGAGGRLVDTDRRTESTPRQTTRRWWRRRGGRR